MAAVIRRRAVAHGRVQGVFFRDTARRLAEERGVTGWARNNSDGTFEAAFEGDAEAVERLVAFCRDGPPGADVERIDVFEEQPEGATAFAVR